MASSRDSGSSRSVVSKNASAGGIRSVLLSLVFAVTTHCAPASHSIPQHPKQLVSHVRVNVVQQHTHGVEFATVASSRSASAAFRRRSGGVSGPRARRAPG